jgi:hypothetical protein
MRNVFVWVFLIAVVACEPAKKPHEVPGPVGCGQRDPRSAGPSTLSVAQQMVLKNNGSPANVDDNDYGGKNWVYYQASGSVFGESETAEIFIFEANGLLRGQKTEIRKHTGK